MTKTPQLRRCWDRPGKAVAVRDRRHRWTARGALVPETRPRPHLPRIARPKRQRHRPQTVPEVAAGIGGPKRDGRTAGRHKSLRRRPRKSTQIAKRINLSRRASPNVRKVQFLSQVPNLRTAARPQTSRRSRNNAQIAKRSNLSSRAVPERGEVPLLNKVPKQRTERSPLLRKVAVRIPQSGQKLRRRSRDDRRSSRKRSGETKR
mmetsp:Transcript_71721/g.233162  ORF Transcript_71721/g.233162 Transcript_71721/m.233162 type:complete len:205 (-) Transcript_71721:1047-1661(-)